MTITISKACELIVSIIKSHNTSGVNASQFAVLAYLYNRPRLCSSVELASGCGLKKRQTEVYLKNSTLESLVRRGYVSIVEQPRSVCNYYSLTPAGRAVVESRALLVRELLK